MINPFIYGTFNATYRTALKRVFSCKMGEWNPRKDTVYSFSSLCFCIYLFISMLFYLHVYLSICLSIYLSLSLTHSLTHSISLSIYISFFLLVVFANSLIYALHSFWQDLDKFTPLNQDYEFIPTPSSVQPHNWLGKKPLSGKFVKPLERMWLFYIDQDILWPKEFWLW